MTDFMDLIGNIGQAANLAQQGIDIFKRPEQKGMAELRQGITLESNALLAAAASHRAAANFDNQIARINTARSLAAQARATERNLSTYRATAAGKGFSTSSKTVMMFMQEELAGFERAVSQQRIAADHEATARNFQAETTARQLEAQAGHARARGRRIEEEFKVGKVSRSKQIIKGIGNLASDVKNSGLLGDVK
jgi:hypothetical protein